MFNVALSSNEVKQVDHYLQARYTALPAPPAIHWIRPNGNQVLLSLLVPPEKSYVLESCDGFPPSGQPRVWTVLTNLPAVISNSQVIVSDTLTAPQRFYRIKAPIH